MSALRIDTLRLGWLEAFVLVVETESVSEAARRLGLHQTTVSRYIKGLERWFGKQLINIGGVVDSDDEACLTETTDAGHELYDIARRAITELQSFRTEQRPLRSAEAVKDDLINKLKFTNNKLEIIPPSEELEFFTSLSEENLRALLKVWKLEINERRRGNALRTLKSKGRVSPGSIKIS